MTQFLDRESFFFSHSHFCELESNSFHVYPNNGEFCPPLPLFPLHHFAPPLPMTHHLQIPTLHSLSLPFLSLRSSPSSSTPLLSSTKPIVFSSLRKIHASRSKLLLRSHSTRSHLPLRLRCRCAKPIPFILSFAIGVMVRFIIAKPVEVT
ncbi:hypothetical protein PanWU01x14_088360 [Parasponia andersonii]|uniref:Transmembrane protein n=1 Tax=Parasponia andersonii TaxID=3476 RepID=A0A2P5D7Y2_PARAD|nr:hypothetical protein PanWU01x14_088360 [Parasponia andersonii]